MRQGVLIIKNSLVAVVFAIQKKISQYLGSFYINLKCSLFFWQIFHSCISTMKKKCIFWKTMPTYLLPCFSVLFLWFLCLFDFFEVLLLFAEEVY